jgi:hypothetical protein
MANTAAALLDVQVTAMELLTWCTPSLQRIHPCVYYSAKLPLPEETDEKVTMYSCRPAVLNSWE